MEKEKGRQKILAAAEDERGCPMVNFIFQTVLVQERGKLPEPQLSLLQQNLRLHCVKPIISGCTC